MFRGRTCRRGCETTRLGGLRVLSGLRPHRRWQDADLGLLRRHRRRFERFGADIDDLVCLRHQAEDEFDETGLQEALHSEDDVPF